VYSKIRFHYFKMAQIQGFWDFLGGIGQESFALGKENVPEHWRKQMY
jgi:hypothetical protein